MKKEKKSINISKNDIIDIKITDDMITGEGVGKWNDIVVLVPKCAIGDELSVRIIKVKSNYLIGKIEKILVPSPDRIESDCEIFSKCGGCAFRHITYEAEKRIKQKHVEDCLKRIGGFKDLNVEEIRGVKEILNYRNKSQIPVGYNLKTKEIISGFFGVHSHNIIPCKNCKLHPTIFDEIIEEIKKWMRKFNILPYDETTHKGTIRHIYLRCSKNCSQIMVCLVVNGDKILSKNELVNSLTTKFENITSIVANYNKDKTNVILGKKFENLYGENYIQDDLYGIKFNISPESFYQVNHDQTEILYTIAKDMLKADKNDSVLDLYCGIGTIGIFVSDTAKNVYGVEIVEKAIENAKENAKLNNVNNIKFFCGDSSNITNKKFLDKNIHAVIVDPPRKGCSDELINDLMKIQPNKIVYISCNPATLAKDLKKICEDEKYKVEKIQPVDLFPRTKHVETAALIFKQNNANTKFINN